MPEASHTIRLELRRPVPREVDCGTRLDVEIVVLTDSGCDLEGVGYALHGEDGSLIETGNLPALRRLTPEDKDYDPRHGAVDERPFVTVSLPVPLATGVHECRFEIPAVTIDGAAHDGAVLPISFNAGRHRTSIVIWNVPSPVESGGRFSARVGLRCTAGCNLADAVVAIHDAGGGSLAQGRLGAESAPGTQGLHFTDIALTAPSTPGPHAWRALALGEDDGRHLPASPAALDIFVVPVSDHAVTLRVTDEKTGTPIASATVRLDAYRALTDADGRATLKVAAGDYLVRVMKDTYVAPDRPLTVVADTILDLAITVPPEKDPYERYWKT